MSNLNVLAEDTEMFASPVDMHVKQQVVWEVQRQLEQVKLDEDLRRAAMKRRVEMRNEFRPEVGTYVHFERRDGSRHSGKVVGQDGTSICVIQEATETDQLHL